MAKAAEQKKSLEGVCSGVCIESPREIARCGFQEADIGPVDKSAAPATVEQTTVLYLQAQDV